MNPCPKRDQFNRLLTEELPAAERSALEIHVKGCTQCQETLEQLTHDSVVQQANKAAGPAAARPPAAVRSGAETGNQAPGQSAANPDSGLVDMLMPSQGAGEIGRLGGYRVLKVLGQGGMGVVFQAEDVHLQRPVALKVMRSATAATPAARDRFLREARACAALKHDHIITIYQVGEERGMPFLAMEFLEGMPLDRWIDSGRNLTLRQILRIGREIARGLAAAHDKGLIHRDIKPANIWLDRDSGRAKILDFGLARGVEDVQLTQSGTIVGTPAYMAPEQARGDKVDGRCDLFSLGALLFRLCTGDLPFKGESTMAVLTALALSQPRRVRDVNPAIPEELSDLIDRLLAKQPDDRPKSARAVVETLQAIERNQSATAVASPSVAAPVAAPPANPFTDLTEASPQVVVPPKSAPKKVVRQAEPRPAASPAKKAQPGGPAVAKRRWILIGLAALVLGGGALAGWVIIRDKNGKEVARVQLPEGGSVEVPDTGKGGPPPTAVAGTRSDWLKQVAALPAEKQVEAVAAKLKEGNPDFDGKMKPRIDNGVVKGLEFDLPYFGSDIAPLRALPGLESLEFGGHSVKDLSPLQGMKLTSLRCNCETLSDLAPLAGMPLRKLDIFWTAVSDLAPLKSMPLEELNFARTPVTDLTPLKELPLKILTGGFNMQRDGAILRSLKTLETINGKPVADYWKAVDTVGKPIEEAWFQQVAALPASKQLEAVRAKLKERSPDLDTGQVGGKVEGEIVAEFWIRNSAILDIAPVAALTKLQRFECRAYTDGLPPCQVTDLSPLRGLKLTAVICRRSQIADLSPLKDMKLTYLDCHSSKVTDLTPIKDMPLQEINCDFKPERDAAILRGIKTLQKINGKPVTDFWKAGNTGKTVAPPAETGTPD